MTTISIHQNFLDIVTKFISTFGTNKVVRLMSYSCEFYDLVIGQTQVNEAF